MQEVFKFIIGIVVLILGFPIGSFLARVTKEELKSGQIWFKSIILVASIGTIISLILRKDVFLFSFLFITIVTSRSLTKKR